MNLNGRAHRFRSFAATRCELTVLQESNVLAALALLICRRARQQKRLQLASVLPAASAISNAELWKLTLRPKLLRLAQRKAHDEGPEAPRNPFCFVPFATPADFFAQRRLVRSWETTYVSRQSGVRRGGELGSRSGTQLQGSAAREGSARRSCTYDTTNP